MTLISPEYEDFLIAFLKQHQKPEAALFIKIQEEVGEAAEQFLSFSNWLWRKNNGASAWDVCLELADVAMTAMIAMVALGYGPNQMLEAQMEKTLTRMREINTQ